MKTFGMAIRNLWRNKTRTFTIGSFSTLATALLLFGNAVFDGSDRGVQSIFIEGFTGDFSIAPASDQNLSIFGNQTPVTGSFSFNPTLSPYPQLYDWLKQHRDQISFTSLVSGLALVETNGYRGPSPVFGIDQSSYFSVFSSVKIVRGGPPGSGERGFMINTTRAERIKKDTGRYPEIGDPILLSVFSESGFQIREVPLTGVFEYPVRNSTLDEISLSDVATMRSLFGYTMANTARTAPPVTESTQSDFSSDGFDIDSFLSGNKDTVVDSEGGLTPRNIESLLADTHERDEILKENEGAWSFVVLRLKDKSAEGDFRNAFEQARAQHEWGFSLNDWRATAGGTAQLSYWVRTIYNIGLIVVLITGLLVIVNTLTIGVAERRSEIGTIRAIGGQKAFVRNLFFFESVALLSFFGLIGVLIGSLIVLLVGAANIPLNNQTLATLFGSEYLRPVLTINSILTGAALSCLIGAVSWIPSVRAALRIPPTQAMLAE